jgi:two-component system, LytTR family, response regulator
MNENVKTILIDDEPRGLKVLEHFCKVYAPELEVVAACTDPFDALARIQDLKPNLVIMDIQMPLMDAFELLNQLKYKEFEIIFATAYDHYALAAFKYSATDYLLKPISEDLFELAVNKAVKKIRSKTGNVNFDTLLYNIQQLNNPVAMKICISDAKGFQVVDVADIISCEADSCYTIFHMRNNKTIISSKTMAEYEPILDDKSFFRIHRSFIINIGHVKEYHRGNGGSVIMSNSKEIEVSRRKKDEFIFKMKQIFKG